ncbi:hypothetical protein BLOT_004479 [Blomia tropicalis]|nr:hypothetical protein BLOT_004479 [Blomia tropicalis]
MANIRRLNGKPEGLCFIHRIHLNKYAFPDKCKHECNFYGFTLGKCDVAQLRRNRNHYHNIM